MKLYDNIPGTYDKEPEIKYYKAEKKLTDGAVIIFPGGGYSHLSVHEGEGYANVLNSFGVDAFVVTSRLSPHKFPLPLLDARRAVRFVRYHSEEYGIDPNKIAVIGSSAGGHLASILSVYKEPLEFEGLDEIDKTNFLPNFQILCYPVIELFEEALVNKGSREKLLGADFSQELAISLSANRIADETAPPAFIWHNADDLAVHVFNSINYSKRLIEKNVPVEMHIFPCGSHGVGAAEGKHCGQWTNLLKNWLVEMNFFNS